MKTPFSFHALLSLTFLLFLSFFSGFASASEHGSPQAIIREYLMASEMLKRCPTVSTDIRIASRREQIAQFGEILVGSLANRARKLSPNLTRSAAAAKVRQWLNRQAAETSDGHLCTLAKNADLLKIIASFRSAQTRLWLLSYGERSDTDIKPVQLESNRMIKTYALPDFQQVAIASIARSHSPAQCTVPAIEKIELVRKKRTETLNRPAYVQDALSVIERWEFACVGRRYWVELSFSRDNDSMLGVYSISGN